MPDKFIHARLALYLERVDRELAGINELSKQRDFLTGELNKWHDKYRRCDDDGSTWGYIETAIELEKRLDEIPNEWRKRNTDIILDELSGGAATYSQLLLTVPLPNYAINKALGRLCKDGHVLKQRINGRAHRYYLNREWNK